MSPLYQGVHMPVLSTHVSQMFEIHTTYGLKILSGKLKHFIILYLDFFNSFINANKSPCPGFPNLSRLWDEASAELMPLCDSLLLYQYISGVAYPQRAAPPDRLSLSVTHFFPSVPSTHPVITGIIIYGLTVSLIDLKGQRTPIAKNILQS